MPARLSFDDLSGEEGLLVAIITQAAVDVASNVHEIRIDAIKFFASGDYERIMEILGMDPEIYPLTVLQCIEGEEPNSSVMGLKKRKKYGGRQRDNSNGKARGTGGETPVPPLDDKWWREDRVAVAKHIGNGLSHSKAGEKEGIKKCTVSYWCRKPGFYEAAEKLAKGSA